MKNKMEQKQTELIKDKAASRIAGIILSMQQTFAGWLQQHSKNWKQRQQWIFFYLVCFVFGGISLRSIVKPFRVSFIRVPSCSAKPVQEKKRALTITGDELRQVVEYKRKHPLLQQERPGLFDSLSLVEEVYHSQSK